MAKQTEILLSDYKVPTFLIDDVQLDINVQTDHAVVSSRIVFKRNKASKDKTATWFLNGEIQKLESVNISGKDLGPKDYKLTDTSLTLLNVPAKGVLKIVSTHNPYTNTALAGLYASGSMLSTQCESEGFRRITYYPDRPDVMAKFIVTIHADRAKYPVLLANGNLIASGKEGKDRHFATWHDPHPKPAYLFAMVAGQLDKAKTTFTTKSGRKVLIEIYVEPGKTSETAFALTAIKNSMKWDEKAYGLEYDLDRFMMVATPYFNMGAMENKGLNIFNDTCVLGRAETATDGTISFIERVVGHEYFHNWTGDRITCRDWFQLSLKEGLTVFREQQFMGDMHSHAVERLDDVRVLRRAQFSEDAGAMAHPIRPDRYEAIDNFYTPTVYEKGAEVCRMIQSLLGEKGFRKGMDLYVKRHDGQAVTCDDFVKAMADANKADLKQFMLWYSQAGTPVLKVTTSYNAKAKSLQLTVEQSTPPTPGQPVKKPLHIPFAIGFLDAKGKDLIGTRMLSLKKARETFTFENIKAKPVLSLLRNFSAPVRLDYTQTDDELLFLLAYDTDAFNRWEAAQKLLTKTILADASGKPEDDASTEKLIAALGNVLRDPKLDAAFKAMVFALPTESELGLTLRARGDLINVEPLFTARKKLVVKIATALKADFAKAHKSSATLSTKATDGVSMGKRSLKNSCLYYLSLSDDKAVLASISKQASQLENMTDRIAALSILTEQTVSPLKDKALKAFEKTWSKTPAVMDKWFAVQASAKRADVLSEVKKLMKHPSYDAKNPNRISSLIGVFAGNGLGFHNADGSGYGFIADMIITIDKFNPHSSAGLAKSFVRWRDYDVKRQKLMEAQLKRLVAQKGLSANVTEIVTKSLKSAKTA